VRNVAFHSQLSDALSRLIDEVTMRGLPASVLGVIVLAGCSSAPSPSPGTTLVPTASPSAPAASVPAVSAALASASSSLAHYSDNGIAFDYPARWQLQPLNVLLRTGPVLALLGTAPSQMSCGQSVGPDCSLKWNLQPGSLSVELAAAESPPRDEPLYAVPVGSGSMHVTIGGLPAIVTTTGFGSGGDAEKSWLITIPGSPDSALAFNATAMDPGADQAMELVDALIASLQYVPAIEPLPTGSAPDTLLASAMEAMAAHDTSFSCFPTTMGETADAVVQQFPGYSMLRKPVPVHCSTAVEETPIDAWRIKLTIAWDAAKDRKPGSLVTYVWVDHNGQPGLEQGIGGDSPPYWP